MTNGVNTTLDKKKKIAISEEKNMRFKEQLILSERREKLEEIRCANRTYIECLRKLIRFTQMDVEERKKVTIESLEYFKNSSDIEWKEEEDTLYQEVINIVDDFDKDEPLHNLKVEIEEVLEENLKTVLKDIAERNARMKSYMLGAECDHKEMSYIRHLIHHKNAQILVEKHIELKLLFATVGEVEENIEE